MHSRSGFTLIEMLTAVTILGILTALAAPSFTSLRLNAGRTAAVNDLFHALYFARSEAVKRGMVVSLCASPDGRQCAASRTASWAQGFLVFVNRDRDEPARVDPAESILIAAGPWRGGHIAANRATFSFRPYVQGGVNGTIVFCDVRGSGQARAIIISHSGRPRISQRDASNRPLPCPT